MTTSEHHILHLNVHKLARVALFGFILTFIVARAFVFLIMAHKMPNLYFFMGETHVHHLNYGIFLLSVVGGYGVFRRPVGRAAEIHGPPLRRRDGAHVRRVRHVAAPGRQLLAAGERRHGDRGRAVFALCAYMRSMERFESPGTAGPPSYSWRPWRASAFVLYSAGTRLGDVYGPRLHELEVSSSP
jgi:hypothetical protein